MENHSHSRPPNKVSKRGTSNGGKFAATSMYDDVFGGPPSFGVPNLSPRPEDYYEIFGGFHASRPTSIPILDLPLGDEEEVECDVRDGDYGEVFGGVGGLDFASSVEELLRQSSSGGGRGLVGGVNGDDSSDGAWTPTETESQSGDSDHFRKNQCSSSGDFYEPIGSSTEFSISYHKVDRRNGDLFNGVTHIAQLDVPDYAWLVDESRLGKKAGNMKPPNYAHDDINLDLAGKKLQGKHLRRTMSHSTKSAAGLNTFTYELDSDGSHGNVGPSSDETFVTISEISLKTQPSEVPPPSRPPPVLDGKRKKHENCQTIASEGIFGSSSQSPPYFDVEIDAGLKSDAENKIENLSKAVDVSKSVADERVQGTGREEDSAMEPSIKQEKQVRKAKSEVQLVVKHKEEQQLEKDSKHMENQKRYKECQETKDDEKRQSKLFECDENDVKLGQVHEQAENEKTTEGAREQEDDTDNSLTQYSEPEESEKKEEEADELDEGEMIWRMALEQLENEKRLNQALELEESWKKGGQACSKEGNEKRSERVLEQENNKKKQVYEREAVEKKVEQDCYAKDTIGKPMEEAFELEDNSIKEALDGEDEMKLKHTQEQEENESLKGINGVQNKFVPEQEEGKNKIVQPPLEQESAETRRKIEVAQSFLGEAQGNTLKTTQPVKPGQSTEKKDTNVGKSLAANEKAKRKIEMENEHLRKKEEKDREREKDRMADDEVTLDARERAFAGAHERAERASMEREAAEARNCFVEDAMAEGAAFGEIERLERSVSDIFSSFSRNTRVGISSSSSDLQSQQFQTTVSFNCPRYSLDNNGVEGEPAQRSKARLERYRRTAERAAKALAEKKMRDLLAQKEQTERNRVADTLDAEFRRWSSGKEKNLRALLSTLQYILGPDSCWQPVPLTEVITSAAVKKAYRKATLCVHPDKLQQRGASIQQKYISEKVYYLLQEAWNRFNSEEW